MIGRAVTARRKGPVAVPDHPGFEGFYREQTPRVVAFLLVLGVQLSTAKDLTQEAMIEVYRRWDSIDHPKTYIRTVVSRNWAKHLASTEFPTNEIPDRTPIDDNSPLSEVLFSETSQAYRRALAQLPPRQRQVMAWTADGYRPREIAEILDISGDNVRANLRKARQTLDKTLRGDLR
ncbi:RNA polymerase sigma factor [Actinokineospora iranica]|uniref:RNA polymerase sigma-70 factor, ECF subfamily n=1 Tax=Actinokineospora iranica TaxID=1271860 RepID=A0A1G6PG58_9PSEU|nr:sigma-70 family RNA polymerase sigma factor [Actinokineospora iranica]SDC78496.1 RNA polymerase sigma-70 factor, ECF subfamily [Actinokineospora iranica]